MPSGCPLQHAAVEYTRASVLLGALLVLALDVAILTLLGRQIENEELKIEKSPDGTYSQFSIFNSQFGRGLSVTADYSSPTAARS